jgi:hypothetical protein
MRHAPRPVVLAALAALASSLAGCARLGRAPPPATWDPDRAPPAVAAAVARADGAMAELRQRLSRRLVEELTDPPRAVSVCRDEAPAMAIAVSASTGVGLGRTSHRLRNAANAPPAWAAPLVAAAAGKKAAEVKAVAVDLGDRIGLLRPIPTGQGCLRCHGPAESLTPGVRDALARGYPADQATGFAEGDLRGFFWAEASR